MRAKSMGLGVMQNMQSDMCRICQVCRIYIDVFSGIPIGMGSSNWHDNCFDTCMRVLNISYRKTQNAMTKFCYLFISIRSVSTASAQPTPMCTYVGTPIKHNGHNVEILAVRGDG